MNKLNILLLLCAIWASPGLGHYYYDSYNNRIIFGDQARFPLCFPNGYPRGEPILRCYQPGWGGSLDTINVPCLPPMFNGVAIPPCHGPYVAILEH